MIEKMEKERYDNVLQRILFQKEFYFNLFKEKTISILTSVLSAIINIY